ncbi:MAG: Smr/MutS family protein [Formivibrio sp.]|nr:Smr/MutS family protein [Formivibrio sp.]
MPLFKFMNNSTLKQLKCLRKTLNAKPKVKAVTTSPALEPSDHELFLQAVRGTLPLANPRYPHPPRFPSPWPRQHHQEDARSVAEAMSDLWPWDELESGEELLFMRPGVQHESLRKLRRGEWLTQAELDLHGLTSESARLAVAEFLHHCHRNHLRCVRIIHGKGLSSVNREPVLKLKLKNWLAQRDDVLAFCQARPVDGGSGAALVLLKNHREK